MVEIYLQNYKAFLPIAIIFRSLL